MGIQTVTRLSTEYHTLVVGPLLVNTYIVIDPKTRHAAIIDPGAEAIRVLAEVASLNVRPVLLLNTHTHGDHIGANRSIKSATMAPLAVHRAEEDWLIDPEMNLSQLLGTPIVSPPADILFEHDDLLRVGDLEILVRHTPGHSPGGTSFVVGDTVFCGDLLFRESVGRTDLPGSEPERLIESIQREILTLPDETVVCPGHGPLTTVGHERSANPFF
ncbi:MAG: MBL fold metallo-hydrolase [bacterium]